MVGEAGALPMIPVLLGICSPCPQGWGIELGFHNSLLDIILVTSLPGWNLSRQIKLNSGVRVLLKASQLYIKMKIDSVNTVWCNIQPRQRGSVESGDSTRVAVKPEFLLWLSSSPVRPYISLRVVCILWNEKQYVRTPSKLYSSIEMKQLLLLLI